MSLILCNLKRLRPPNSIFEISRSFVSTYKVQGNIKQPSILDRTLDKSHRSFYRLLDRERHRYNKQTIGIEPTIRHLMVLFQKEHEGKFHEMKLSDQKLPNPYKVQQLLEPITFHCILALHYITKKKSLNSKYVDDHCQIQQKYLTSTIEKIVSKQSGSCNYNEIKQKIEQQLDINIYEECLNLVSRFNCIRIAENESFELLEMSLLSFLLVSKEGFKNQYTIQKDLIPWILSFNASNITKGCKSLSNLMNIPPFITSDILLRTPMSKDEYYLQLDIWSEFMKDIAICYHKKTKHLKNCITNLIFYGIHYDSNKLPSLMSMTLAFFSSTKSGFQFNLLTKDFLNDIIWKLIYDYLRSPIPSQNNAMTNIVKTQEIIVRHLSRIGNPDDKPHTKLDLKGHMGIVLAIKNISEEKAERLFNIAEKRFIYDECLNDNKSLASYNVTKIFLSSTPEQLLHNFNTAAIDHSQSAALWLSFVKKLKEFGLLNEKRSKKVLVELVNNIDKVLITKDIVLTLSQPIKSLSSINEFIKILQNAKYDLAKVHSSSILPKYLTLLYRNVHSKTKPETYMSWDINFNRSASVIIPNELPGFKNIPSIIDYARYLYEKSFRKKTPNIVGIMLNGEAHIQPENLYDLYKKELFDDNDLTPDSSCLAALIKAALKIPDDMDSCIMWGDMYAPQVAIHEFKKHVMVEGYTDSIKRCDNDSKVYPNDDLWQKYIRMLSKYEYISELSTLIQWWEQLQFIPNSDTLLMLLGSLPIEYAERYLKHIEKVRNDSAKVYIGNDKISNGNQQNNLNWPWPTIDNLNKLRQRNRR